MPKYLLNISRLGMLFYLLLFPFGTSFREIGAWTAFSSVMLLYALDFSSTNGSRLGRIFWLFPAFWGGLCLSLIYSLAPSSSWYVLRHNLHMGFGLFFVGLEFTREEKDLRLPVYAMAVCGGIQGLLGVWQAVFGVDPIYGTPLMGGRLTGSFSTYRVGNLIALYILPIIGLYWALPRRLPQKTRMLYLATAILPALFLLVGSRTRSAVLGLATAIMFSWFALRKTWWKAFLVIVLCIVSISLIGPQRFTLQGVLQDPRILELWPFALRIFEHWPLFGSGINTYNAAFRSLGLAPVYESIDIPHPHNIYLQLLCETGIVGLLFFLVMVIILMRHAVRCIVPQARAGKRWWQVAALFMSTYVCYLVMGISAHSFFRTWWLGTTSLMLGLALGFCAASQRPGFVSNIEGNPT